MSTIVKRGGSFLRRYGWILIAVVIGSAFLLWSSILTAVKNKAEDLKPKLKVVSVSITDIQDARIKSTLWIILINPLPVEIYIPKLTYNILIDSVKVIESAYNKPVRVKASGESRIVLPMETLSKPMGRILDKFEAQNRDSAVYSFHADLAVDIPIVGTRNFTITEEKEMPAIRLWKLKMDKVDVDKLGFNESRLDMMVHIENPSLFALYMKNTGYTFTIDKVLELNGTLMETINLPPRGSQSIPMVLDIKTAKIVRLTWKALFEKKHTNFTLNFYGTLISTDSSVHNSTMTLSVDGTLYDLQKLKKKGKEKKKEEEKEKERRKKN